jgi:hypothetical protein
MCRVTVGCTALVVLFLGPAVRGKLDESTEAEVRQKLKTRVTESVSEFDTLDELLAFLGKKYGLKAALDQAAFEKAGIKHVGNTTGPLPCIYDVRMEVLLELAIRPVSGTIQMDKGRLLIVPGKPRDFESFLPPPGKAMREKLLRKTALERPISNAPLRDILSFLSDKYEVNIFVHTSAFFDESGFKYVLDVPCSSPAADTKLIECLNYFAAQVKGKVLVRDEVILILPQSTK